jgi:hypothetical protein
MKCGSGWAGWGGVGDLRVCEGMGSGMAGTNEEPASCPATQSHEVGVSCCACLTVALLPARTGHAATYNRPICSGRTMEPWGKGAGCEWRVGRCCIAWGLRKAAAYEQVRTHLGTLLF